MSELKRLLGLLMVSDQTYTCKCTLVLKLLGDPNNIFKGTNY